METQQDERSLGQLFGDLGRQLSTLIQKEIQLARTEMTTRVTTVGRDAATIGAGGALAYAALIVGLMAVSFLLADVLNNTWLGFLIVAAIVGVIAAVLIQRGRAELQKTELAPRQTIETIKEDAEWAKQQVK
jgi:F0F1-type ATP synthase assembly protein I